MIIGNLVKENLVVIQIFVGIVFTKVLVEIKIKKDIGDVSVSNIEDKIEIQINFEIKTVKAV